MKILMITPNPFFIDRGFSIRVYNEAAGLQKSGHDVLIVAYNSGRNMPGIKIKRIPDIPGYGAEELGAKLSRIYLDIFLFFSCFIAAIKFKPDILHGHLHEGAFIGIIIGKILRIPVLLDAQGSLTGELKDRGVLKKGLLLKTIKTLEKYIVNKVNIIIVSTPVMQKILLDEFNLDAKKTEIVLDRVDLEIFDMNKNSALSKKRLNIPDNAKIAIYLGTLHEYYGTDCLLKSIAYIVNKNVDNIHFLILGHPNVKKYKQMAYDLKIEHVTSFLGRVDYFNTHDYLKLADIALAPKLGGTEANGKLLLYMAYELPVVCFDTIINRLLLGEDAQYVRLGDYWEFGKTIIETVSNIDAAKITGKRLRKKVEENFSLKDGIIQMNDIYEKLKKINRHKRN